MFDACVFFFSQSIDRDFRHGKLSSQVQDLRQCARCSPRSWEGSARHAGRGRVGALPPPAGNHAATPGHCGEVAGGNRRHPGQRHDRHHGHGRSAEKPHAIGCNAESGGGGPGESDEACVRRKAVTGNWWSIACLGEILGHQLAGASARATARRRSKRRADWGC
jgi:hypothetical protein